MAEVQLALIGGGGISRAHIGAARATGGRVAFVAVVDPSESARTGAADAAGGAAPFASLQDLFASDVAKKVQGVVVCTPPSARLDIVTEVLNRGISVLAEKPLAHRVDDARKLADLAEENANSVSAVGYCHRFTPAANEIKRRIESGALGSVSRFENTFAFYHPQMQQKWMSDPAISGGGSFIDTGCHSLDLFHYLIGPGKVNAAIFHKDWPGRGESSATVLVESSNAVGAKAGDPEAPNHVAGVIQAGWMEPARFTVSVVGTKGSLAYDYDKPTELLWRPNDGQPETIIVESHEVRFRQQLEAFANAVVRREPSRLATFVDGLRTAEMVDQALRIGNII